MALEHLFHQVLSLQSQRSEIWAPDRGDRKKLQGHTNRHSFAMSSQKNMVKSNPDPPAASQYILSSAFDLLYYEMCLSPSYPLHLVLVLLGKTCSYSKHLSPFCDEFFIRDVVLQKFLPEEGII